jgi:phospholipase/carboxylesterase
VDNTLNLQPAALSLEHVLRAPEGAPSGTRLPALLALHGRGSSETDLVGLAPYLDERLLWISPRAPLPLDGGFEWYRLQAVGVPDQPTFEAALETLDRFLDEIVAAYPIDPAHLYLFGFSQGGMLSYAHSLTRERRAAGLVAHSSYVPLPAVEATGRLNPARVRGLPVLILHGTRDPLIPVRWAHEARDTLTAHGADVRYLEFPMAHHASDRSIAAMDEWLRQRLEKASEG